MILRPIAIIRSGARALIEPIAVRERTMIAVAIILSPICALLLLSLDRLYGLAEVLRTDGHASAFHETTVFCVTALALALVFSATALCLGAIVVERRLLRPMRHLTQVASSLAEGNLDTRVEVSRISIADMRTLGATLNTMAAILANLALTDGLTCVANRRRFDQAVEGEVKRSTRMKKGVALILVDVDKFKDYNDLYGHAGGDICLQRIARALQNGTRRPSDLVARYGGEEFALLLPETDEEGACTVAMELLSSIRALNIPHEAWEKGIVTISIGVAVSCPPAVIDPTVLIERADQALYAAKQAGRDRVLIHAGMTPAA